MIYWKIHTKWSKRFASVVVEFMPDALTWDMGADTGQYSWWDGGSFHQNLKNSTGLKPQVRKYVELDDAPDRVKQVHRRMVDVSHCNVSIFLGYWHYQSEVAKESRKWLAKIRIFLF